VVTNYAQQDKTISLGIFKYLPADHYPKMGSAMQKYITGSIDRKGFLEEMNEYWKVKGKLK
jgi:raffinose/stachyose/melibiose transport system substrate-binding protein